MIDTFEKKQKHYQEMLGFYNNNKYPEKDTVTAALGLMNDILSQSKDNVALFTHMVERQDDLLDSAEDMEDVEVFFKTQRAVFDSARERYDKINRERDYFSTDSETLGVLKTIAEILAMEKPYKRISELPELVQRAGRAYDNLLDSKRDDVAENIRQCMEDVHQLAMEAKNAGELLHQADDYFVSKRDASKEAKSLTELDAMIMQTLTYKNNICKRLEALIAPVVPDKPDEPVQTRTIKTVRRLDLCPVKRLQSREDIESYVGAIREKLMETLESCDAVQIN